jgi:DNA-binding transcriptional MerR regulator
MADARSPALTIAELAERAGVTPRTIRYYVAEGLLPPPGGSGQHRVYGQAHLDRLQAIRNLKAAYLPLHEIRRKLVAAYPYADVNALRSARSVVPTDASAPPPTDPGGVGAAAVSTAAPTTGQAASLPFGFGQRPQVGRIEIYEPTESVWHRYTLAPGIELHYQETTDPALSAAIERLIREASAILDEKPDHDRSAKQAP